MGAMLLNWAAHEQNHGTVKRKVPKLGPAQFLKASD